MKFSLNNWLASEKMVWVIFALACLLYVNTLTHDYVLDDGIVIRENKFTKQGFRGIWDILTTDSFFGFLQQENKEKLVSGGRYRPLSVISFAVEYQFSGANPFVGHLFTTIYYGLLCMLIYHTLSLLFNQINDSRIISAIASLIFVVHPVHTEVVANIKGRDEIFALLFSIAALWSVLKYFDTLEKRYSIYACVLLFLGLMSKENSITFLAVIPLSLVYFRRASLVKAFTMSLALIIPTLIFLTIRFSVIGSSFGAKPLELMNNPFLKWVNNQYLPLSFMEQLPTIFFTWGVYIKLLFWPLVLTNDYYPKHIDIMDMNNIWVWFSLLLNLGLLIIALFLYKRNKVISFGIFYYFITFSIVSNLIFPIGTHMAERFIFMPSLGFSVALAAIITQLPQKMNRLVILISTIFMIFFATKTVSRNLDWKNNYSLFMKDVTSSPNSAKALCAAGGVLLEDMGKKSDVQKETDIKRSMLYLEKALQIHPTYENAMLLLGNAYFYKNELEKAITCYRKVLETYPDQQNAKTNLAMTLRDYGKYLGETKGDVVKAKSVLEESLTIVPDDIETLRLLAVANGFLGDHIKAIDLFNKVLEKQPQNPNVYINLSEAYRIIGDKTAAETFKVKALQLDPNILNK